MADIPEYSIEEQNHYRIWYNMPEGAAKLLKGPLGHPFSRLSAADRFKRIQHMHFRTWCNLPAGPEKDGMPMLVARPPVSNYVWRYPACQPRPCDNWNLDPRARYACWEQACIHTFCRVMNRNKVIMSLCRIIIDYFNPYTPGNVVRAKKIEEEEAEFAEHCRTVRTRRRAELDQLQR